jgi:hypothetical protein
MIMYEQKTQPLLPAKKFYRRLLYNLLVAIAIIIISLMIGIAGYTSLAGFNFPDALLNASMILSGMGPVGELPNNASKYFASFYSLFSGITFLTTVAFLLAPVVHRGFHRFHLETEEEENSGQ